jgi:hypothetical protein
MPQEGLVMKNSIARSILYILLTVAVAFAAACGSNSGDASSPVKVTKASAPQLTEPEDHGGGFGWENDKCYLCHPVVELEKIHDYSPGLAESFAASDTAESGFCLYCHGTNGLSVSAEDYMCTECHTSSNVVKKPAMFAGHTTHDVNGDGKMSNADCVVCHEFSDMNGAVELSVDFRSTGTDYASSDEFCLACHDGNGAFGIMPPALQFESEVNNIHSTYIGTGDTDDARKQTADIHGAKDGDGQSFAEFRGLYTANTMVSCLSCHQVHTSDNPYLITESGESADLADEAALEAGVKVEGDDFTELCALCHASVNGAPTANGLKSVVHNSTYSTNCTDCHYHGAGHGTDSSGLF